MTNDYNEKRTNNNFRSKPRINFPSFRLGQVFGFIYNIALLGLVYKLIQVNEKDLAIKLFSINAGLILVIFLVLRIERFFFNKNKSGRNWKRRRPENFKERENRSNFNKQPRRR